MDRTLIIAEAGVNHNGSMHDMHALVDAAKDAGADAVKFQAFTAERLDPPGPRRDMLKSLELTKDHLQSLAHYAETAGIEFMVTPFDADWCSWCAWTLPLRRIKIASGCLWDADLLNAAVSVGFPVILSTGLTDADELDQAIAIIELDLTLLHCVSRYPTGIGEINLKRMTELGSRYCRPVGLSDHSLSVIAPALAVAMGATVIEKHLTLSRSQAGPDHLASLEPAEFAEMARLVREAEKMCGSGDLWRVQPGHAAAVKKERMEWRSRRTS